MKSYPGVTFASANKRWRYRTKGRDRKTTWLDGQPGTPEFDASYQAAIEGRPKQAPAPKAAEPRTFDAAERLYEQTDEYRNAAELTITKHHQVIGRFMRAEVDPRSTLKWRDMLVEHMTTEILETYLDKVKHENSPGMAHHAKVAIRKLLQTAKKAKWITSDPSLGVVVKVPYSPGHRAWPREIREQFEAFHPIGSQARTAYALGFWLGNRRSDVARLRWDSLDRHEIRNLDGDFETVLAFAFRQKKNSKRTGGKQMFLKCMEPLVEALAPLDRTTEYVLTSRHGGAFKDESVSSEMLRWTRQAGIPDGYTMHGLRKSLGCYLAENGATAIEIMHILGHSTLKEAQKYIEEANRQLTSTNALTALETRERIRQAKVRRAAMAIVA
jgi:integrase